MPNERLRGTLAARNLTSNGLAELVGVSAKTVERWVTQNRCPHPMMRLKVARVLDRDETYLWPHLLTQTRTANASISELVQLWPTRSAVPDDVWRALMHQANDSVHVLVYSGGFLFESLDFVNYLKTKAANGTEFRILVGDSESEAVRARAREEGLPSLVQRCRSTLEYLSRAADLPTITVRIHHTPLYTSIFQFDDSMLVNTHSYGAYAANSPVQHLQRVPGGQLFSYYRDSFEAVWATARPAVF